MEDIRHPKQLLEYRDSGRRKPGRIQSWGRNRSLICL